MIRRMRQCIAVAALIGGLTWWSVPASGAEVLALGPVRGYDNGGLFQLVLPGHSMDAARTALQADGHFITATESFDAEDLEGYDVVFIGLMDPNATLSAHEQSSLLAFVRNGGALIYLGDNNRFAVPNASVAGMFGVTFSEEPSGTVASDVPSPGHAIVNGPAGTVSGYDGSGNAKGFCGGVDRTGPYAQPIVRGSMRTAVAVIERNALQPGSGPVVFIADGNGFMDAGLGGIQNGDNLKLLRNIFAFAAPATDGCVNSLDCDDGVFCNGAETCVGGECADGAFPCPPGSGCHELSDSCGLCTNNAQCDDGLFCNGVETCVAGVCQHGDFPCNNGLGCNELTDSCAACDDLYTCDDGVFCNGLEVCIAGSCRPGSFPCHDGEGCSETEQTCGPCESNSQCDDGQYCNGVETCDAGVCRAGSFPCTDGLGCNESTDDCETCGANATCDDGVFCNGDEACVNDVCRNGASPCETGEICDESEESCRPCVSDEECDDGVFCNGAEQCNIGTGLCQPGSRPCAGQLCQEEEQTCVKVTFAVVTTSGENTGVASVELPPSQNSFTNGEVFYAEVWAQTSHAEGLGCMYTDVHYGATVCPLDATAIVHGPEFSGATSGTIMPPNKVDEFGGCAVPPELGVSPLWHLVGRVELQGGEDCSTEVCLEPATTPSTNRSGAAIASELIGYDCRTVSFSQCLYDLDGDNFVGPGDLGLFAGCWLCCEGDPCWSEGQCDLSNFDCDSCVGPGDLSYFATAWLADCAKANAVVPPCQSTTGIQLPPAGPMLIREFRLTQPPAGWPTTRNDWYTKLRAKASAEWMQRMEARRNGQ